uniref:Putative GIY-YIG homing endonuclease n=1 Tax=Carteria sp. SAG 8-5 TaxID=1756294 RepID=A0A0S2LPS7_9CHLO|nr:putative GIY-YIG homing endonuclease [Carteria sp. SAG 8-5]ALO63405.1 putative GIY-YIG homing endonuclease [Carteria sp. SAG 8-5]
MILFLKTSFLVWLLSFRHTKVPSNRGRLETCLNGKPPFVLGSSQYQEPASIQRENVDNKKENSVPNQIQIRPRKQTGIYMIRCIDNDWRYYGESNNVSGRLSSHRSLLSRNIHPNTGLQNDWNKFGADHFEYVVLYMGDAWESRDLRQGKELELIVLNREIAYNILEESKNGEKNPFWGRVHTPEAKRKISEAMKGIPNDKLGKKISVNGVIYPSLAEASRQTNMARKTLCNHLKDPNKPNVFAVDMD